MEGAKPFIIALKAYHGDTGDYPRRLDDLRPRYLAANVPLHGNRTNATQVWELTYERVNQDRYKLYLYFVPCTQVMFENGRFVGANYK